MRRVPDIMPVSLQDKLWYRKSEVREEREERLRLKDIASEQWAIFFYL
jgi:hypothetical protein